MGNLQPVIPAFCYCVWHLQWGHSFVLHAMNKWPEEQMFKASGRGRRGRSVQYQRGAPIIQLEIFWIHETPGEALRLKGWLFGRAIFWSPDYIFFFLHGQENISFARQVNENKCLVVWWWSGLRWKLWSLTPLCKKQPSPPPSYPGPTKSCLLFDS